MVKRAIGHTNRAVYLPIVVFVALMPVFYILFSSGDNNYYDFKGYLTALRAVLHGQDPYVTSVYERFADGIVSSANKYPYHPYTFILWLPFVLTPYAVSWWLYFLLNVSALWTFLTISTSLNIPRFSSIAIPSLVFVGAFRSPVTTALWTGNPVIFEALLIWWGIFLITKGRIHSSILIFAVISFIKVQPALLSALLFLAIPSMRIGIMRSFLIALFFIGIYISGAITLPDLFWKYINFTGRVRELGPDDSSIFALVSEVVSGGGSQKIALAVYSSIGVGILFSTMRTLRKKTMPLIVTIHYLVLTYCLILPRLKDYTYLVALPSVVFVVSHEPRLLILLFLSYLDILGIFPPIFLRYADLVGLASLWALYPLIIKNEEVAKGEAIEAQAIAS